MLLVDRSVIAEPIYRRDTLRVTQQGFNPRARVLLNCVEQLSVQVTQQVCHTVLCFQHACVLKKKKEAEERGGLRTRPGSVRRQGTSAGVILSESLSESHSRVLSGNVPCVVAALLLSMGMPVEHPGGRHAAGLSLRLQRAACLDAGICIETKKLTKP